MGKVGHRGLVRQSPIQQNNNNTMKTFEIIIRIENSTIVEIQAEDYATAEAKAYDYAYDTGVVHDLCNPSDVMVTTEKP